jgi:hypothetical protein
MITAHFARWSFLGGLLCSAFCLTGCDAIPVSQHPLSNAENSVLDEQLYGQWDVYHDDEKKDDEKKPAEPAADKAEADPEGQPRFIIGKATDRERTHELLSVQVSDTGEIETKRIPFFAMTLGERKVISINLASPADTAEFGIFRYELVNPNRLLVYMLDRDVITNAIKRGELDGVVKSKTRGDDPNVVERRESIRITATAEKLRDFLKKHEKTAFAPKHVFRLQRASQQ